MDGAGSNIPSRSAVGIVRTIAKLDQLSPLGLRPEFFFTSEDITFFSVQRSVLPNVLFIPLHFPESIYLTGRISNGKEEADSLPALDSHGGLYYHHRHPHFVHRPCAAPIAPHTRTLRDCTGA